MALSHLDRQLQISHSIFGNLDAWFGRVCDVLRKLNEVLDLDAIGRRSQSRLLVGSRICFSGELSSFAFESGSRSRGCGRAVIGVVGTASMFPRGSEQPSSHGIGIRLVSSVARVQKVGVHFRVSESMALTKL